MPTLSAASLDRLGEADTALDPNRFRGLKEPLLWREIFVLPETLSWAKANAVEISRLRATGMSMEVLAGHFGKSVPTIRQALAHAKAKDPSLASLPAKAARQRWEEDHAAEVKRLRNAGMNLKELVAHFGKTEPTIRQALRFAVSTAEATPKPTENPNEGDLS